MGVAVLVGTMKGAFVMRSTNASRTEWDLEGPYFKGWQVTAAGRAEDGRFIVGTSSHVYGATLHVSRDLATWDMIEHGPRYEADENRKLKEFWTLATTPLGIFAGVSEAGLFHATDPCGPWEQVRGLNDHVTRDAWQPGLGGLCAHVLLANPHNPRQLWCGVSAVGVFRSDDGGESWHPKNRGVTPAIEDKEHKDIGTCVHGLALSPRDAQTLYRQDHLGMFRSNDGAESWHENALGLPSNFGFAIKTDPNTGTLFCYPLESDHHRLPAGGKMRVYRSTDGGSSWHTAAQGLPQEDTYATVLRGAMDVDGLDPCGVYFGTTSGTVHASSNRGDSWQSMNYLFPRILCVEAFVI